MDEKLDNAIGQDRVSLQETVSPEGAMRAIDTVDRLKVSERAGYVGILCNLLLFASKVTAGVLARSVSVIADGFNNLSDAGSSIISVVASRMAGKKADEDHPFGHGRIEYVAAFIVSVLILVVGVETLKESCAKILHPELPETSALTIGVLVFSIFVKLFLGLFYRRVAKRIDSQMFLATAQDAFSDIMTTGAALLSVLILMLLHVNIDAFVGAGVSLIGLWNGVKIAKETLEPLIGESIDPKIYYEIMEFVGHYDGIYGVHDLIVHNYGPNQYMATVHVEVDGKSSVEASHERIDCIEKECFEKLGIHLLIHMDPHDTSDRAGFYEGVLAKALSELCPEASFHDFQIMHDGQESTASAQQDDASSSASGNLGTDRENEGTSHHAREQQRDDEDIVLHFDLVTPWTMSDAEQSELLSKLVYQLRDVNPHLRVAAELDKPFMHTHSGVEDAEARARALFEVEQAEKAGRK